MTAKKTYPEKFITASQSKSFYSDSTSRLLKILCDAGLNGVTIYDLNEKYNRYLSRNTVYNHLGRVQAFLLSLSTENSGSIGIEKFKKDGDKSYYYRVNNISLLQSLLGSNNDSGYLSSRLLSFSVSKPLRNTAHSPSLCAVQPSEKDYLLLAHRFAVDIAIREYGYPVKLFCDEEELDEFNDQINILETAGKTIRFRQPARVCYTDGCGRQSVTLAPLALTRKCDSPRNKNDCSFSDRKTIHLTGICIDSTKSSSIYLSSLEKKGICNIDFFDKNKDLITVPVRTIESIKPVYTGNKPSNRAVFSVQETEQTVCTDNDDGDLLNLCGRPFEVDIFDSLLEAERQFNSEHTNDWMVGFEDETSDEKIVSVLREEGLLEEDEYGYKIPVGLEDFFFYPERKVQCVNYLKLVELFLHFDLEPKAESLPEFLKHDLKNKALRYLKTNEPDTTTDYQHLLTESKVSLPLSDNKVKTHLYNCSFSSFREEKEIDFIGNTLGYTDADCLYSLHQFFDGIDKNPRGEKYLIPVYTLVKNSSGECVALIPLAINTDSQDNIVLTCLNADSLMVGRTEGEEECDIIYSQIIQALNGIIFPSDLQSLLYTIPIKDALSQAVVHRRCRSAEIKEQMLQSVFAFKERFSVFCDPLFDSLIQQKRCYRVVLRSDRTDSTGILIPDCFEILPPDKTGGNDSEQTSAAGLSDVLRFETCEHRLVLEFLQKYAGVVEISKDEIKTVAALRRLVQRQYRFILE